MTIAVKKFIFVLSIIFLLGFVSALQANVEGVAKRGLHDNIAGARIPILSPDDAVGMLDFADNNPNADEIILDSRYGGVFAAAMAGVTVSQDEAVQSSKTVCTNHSQCSPVEVCLGGFCDPVVNCSDSDNGLNYGIKGTTYGVPSPEFAEEIDDIGIQNLSDSCGTGEEIGKLSEFSCNVNNRLVKNLYTCNNGCLNGVCVNSNSGNNSCTDTDNGYTTAIFGNTYGQFANGTNYSYNDSCNGNRLIEWGCEADDTPSILEGPCQYGCNNGLCRAHNNSNMTCIDTDDGRNYTIFGRVYGTFANGTNYSYNDSCTNTNIGLKEWYCSNDAPTHYTGEICQTSSCSNGACTVDPSCTPSCSGKQCGNNGCGGSCGICSGANICNASGQCVSAGGNQPPVNLTINGPVSIDNFGVSTSWEISARDPEGGVLKYRVYYGDTSGYQEFPNRVSGSTQSIEHTYNKPTNDTVKAIFKMKVIAYDNESLSTIKEQEITVIDSTSSFYNNTGNGIIVTKPTAGTYYTGNVMEIKWTAPTTVSMVTIYGMRKLSTGAWDSNLIANNVPSSGGGQYNFLLGSAGTNIQVIGRDSATGDYISDLSDTYTILQGNNSPTTPSFAVGGRVQVTTQVYPRLTPNGNSNYYDFEGNYIQQPQGQQGTAYYNNKGTIKEGPSEAGALTWWKVDFDTGTDGWMASGHIKAINESNQPFAFTSDSLINPVSVYVGDSYVWTLKGNVPSGGSSGCTGPQAVVYKINFGDGTPEASYTDDCLGGIMGYAPESVMKHTYTTNGTFIIRGNATSNVNLHTGSATKTLSVVASYKPITISKFEVQSKDSNGMPTQFRILATGGAPGALTFSLNFDDGNTTSYSGTSGGTINPTHTYANIGNWNPTLTVTDAKGQSASKQLYNPSSIKPPTISNVNCPTTFTRTTTTSYMTCTFRIDSQDGGNIWYSIDWNGDGTAEASAPTQGYLSGQTHTQSKACSITSCPQQGVVTWPVTIRVRTVGLTQWWADPFVKNIVVN